MLSSFPPFSLVILTLFGNVQGATWNPLGCYPDPSTSRTLRAASYSDLANFTIDGCSDFCSSKGYNFAGMEYGHECFCDWRWHNLPLNPNSCDCFTAHCTGETNSYCGGSDCLQVFHRDPTFPPPTIAPLENGYQFEGCYTDSTDIRTLEKRVAITDGVTVAKCTVACRNAGFSYAGVEFGSECFCGNSIRSPGHLTALDDCNDMQCTGDSSQLCGAADRLLMYHYIP